jgi:hypothetical chaperone protein
MRSNRSSIAIDFGTSNTVIAVARPDGEVAVVKFGHGDDLLRIYASALCFWEERDNQVPQIRVEGGPWAVEQFLDGVGPHRFIQSFKTFAASKAFQETWIFRRKFRFEDLLAAFLRTLVRHADVELNIPDSPIVVGRPVRFAGSHPDDSLAMGRYAASFEQVGVKKLHYVYEPAGAAFFFARRVAQTATVLIADFGGGTSDFSIMRFSRQRDGLRAEPLGNAGIGIAGDAFDYRIIDHVVSPKLGKGGYYRSFGKRLTIPNSHYSNFARWNQLAMMKSSGELEQLVQLLHLAVDPEPLRKFIDVVEGDLGFALYRAVSKAKIALSSQAQTDFEFRSGPIDIQETIRRDEFEQWIDQDVSAIAATVDKALEDARVTTSDVDRVFLTGGSSFIPAIRRIFSERFGEERLETGDQFESIACGLALIGQSDDVAQWSVSSV